VANVFRIFFWGGGISLKTVTQLLLYTHLPSPLYSCEDPGRTAHYHIIDILKVVWFVSDPALGWSQSKGDLYRITSHITAVAQVSGMLTRC
jgi:hypothetical protein